MKGTTTRDGRRLAWTRAGRGSPAVVLEAGIGASGTTWALVFDLLAEFTTVLAYDRLGYGASGDGPASPEAAGLDLEQVLRDVAVEGPLVLVGHSWGGVLARRYATAHPDDVAGIVLVDATHEGVSVFTNPVFTALSRAGFAALARRSRRGRLRRSLEAGRGRLGSVVAGLPAAARAELLDELCTPRTWEQAVRETRTVAPALRSLPADSPLVPVVAVVGTAAGSRPERRERALIGAAYRAWLPTLADGRLVEAPNSGHAVPHQDPDLLVETIRGLVREVAGQGA